MNITCSLLRNAAIGLIWLGHLHLQAQQPPFLSLQPADSLCKARLGVGVGLSTAAFGALIVHEHRSWLADDLPSDRFQSINDLGDWNQMDKMNHWMMSYNLSRWTFSGARWAGVNNRAATWLGFAGSQLIMTSLEVYDGFSSQWGFSWGDAGFNLLGSGMFAAQQLGWGEQRITMKMSAWPKLYPSDLIYPYSPPGSDGGITLQQRSDALYGTGLVNLFMKNYNAVTVWASVNPRSFMPQATWAPRWLNIAVGMGAENLFVGQGYEWKGNRNCEGPDCAYYRLDPAAFPRTRQFFLSFDVDFTRLPIRNRFLRTLAGAINIIKIPAPTLEITDRGRVRVHGVYF
jgi:hypothetical protein